MIDLTEMRQEVRYGSDQVRVYGALTILKYTGVTPQLWLADCGAEKTSWEINAMQIWSEVYGDLYGALLELHKTTCQATSPAETINAINEIILMLENNRRKGLGITTRSHYGEEDYA